MRIGAGAGWGGWVGAIRCALHMYNFDLNGDPADNSVHLVHSVSVFQCFQLLHQSFVHKP